MRVLIMTLLLVGCSPEAVRPIADVADLLLRGGHVITVDPEIGSVQAVAIRGHEIIAVGDDDWIDAYIGAQTTVIELNGRSVVPGLIEGHGHFLSLGRAQQILDLRNARDFSAIIAKVAQAVDQAEPGEWILGRGWHQDKWTHVQVPRVDGVPVNGPLSAISPENPVLLGHASGHAALANDAALVAAGIDHDTADPPGGTIVRDANGKATGLLRETAQRLVGAAVASYDSRLSEAQRSEVFREQVRLAGQVALAHGVTSFHDAGADFATIDRFKLLAAELKLPVRLYVMVRKESNEQMAARLADYLIPAQGNDFLAVRSIKREIDGALGAHGAWLLEPYVDLPDSSGLVLEPVKQIEATARLALEHGFQVNTHAIGTRANREVLDLYERVWKAAQIDGSQLRWRIEHAQHIHPQDIPRFGQLGVIAAVQGIHCISDGPWIPSRLGQARAEQTSYRWRDLIDSGARINNGTDVPVEPIDPFASIHASIGRVMNNGQVFVPEQAMTRAEALRSYTLDNAYSEFAEHLKGSITPGKLADLVVLDGDFDKISAAQINTLGVVHTIVGGEIRYSRRIPERTRPRYTNRAK